MPGPRPTYCSHACQRQAYQHRRGGERTKRTCPRCGQPFPPSRSPLARFCSAECTQAARVEARPPQPQRTARLRPRNAESLAPVGMRRLLEAEGRREAARQESIARWRSRRGLPDPRRAGD
jgi:hypothetical protein